ncbi:unnamed protein product [Macrosiphum euphorbiae]|uniref:Uncharacterized protein n=1 Tax=Macrosiphum euphorbiae TaxID=13131 RepID=A0AAV0XY60_9HEMI|nr:unnamed protein product [Macrosiphum euphorbiae]CAI6372161.1 unnamed protein product [Macrosiphum euphorbiae]
MDRNEQLLQELNISIAIQTHTNSEQGEWYNFTECFDYHIISANNAILVPYESREVLEIIKCVKRFVTDMVLGRDLTNPICMDLARYIEIIPQATDILFYDR